jgi:hypothetical protein
MAPDSSLVLNALIARLGADTALLGLMPNNVFEDVAPAGSTRFVIVSQIMSTDVDVFSRRALEAGLFLVEARSRNGGDVQAAAARIDVLLDGITITVANYGKVTFTRVEFVRGTEADDADSSILWQRRGGRYRAMASPT